MIRYSQEWWNGFVGAFAETDRHVPRGVFANGNVQGIEGVALGFRPDAICPVLGWDLGDGEIVPAEFSGEPMLVGVLGE